MKKYEILVSYTVQTKLIIEAEQAEDIAKWQSIGVIGLPNESYFQLKELNEYDDLKFHYIHELTEPLPWRECSSEDIIDNAIAEYCGFLISLSIPNGGIVGVNISDEERKIFETLDTDIYDKHLDEDWHIKQAKLRINQILNKKQITLDLD